MRRDLCIIWPEDMRMTHGASMRYLLANNLFPVDFLLLYPRMSALFQTLRLQRCNFAKIKIAPAD